MRFFTFFTFLFLISLPAVSNAQEISGYVLTHEHPTQGMAFGGNYAFAGAGDNYVNGIMVEGYSARCSGCKVAGLCDHGEVKGSLAGTWIGGLGKDMGNHSAHYGPLSESFSHLRYSTDWIREAFQPTEEEYQDSRARIMVAYAVESEAMCHQLYDVNKKQGGAGGSGFPCSQGDSYASMIRQLDSIEAWVADNSDWMEIALTAADARRIVTEDKMAIILGVEADYAFGSEASTFDPVDRLNDYYERGVRTFYPSHKINSRLSGADVFLPRSRDDGKAIRVSQALAGCFYYDDYVGHFPLKGRFGKNLCDNEQRCDSGAFLGGGPTSQCSYNIGDVSEINIASYIKTMGAKKFNGFHLYPLPPGFTEDAISLEPANAAGSDFHEEDGEDGIERNNLGLSHDGERIIREGMTKGMIITLDHISSKARKHVKEISEEFNDYPLNALHNKPVERLNNENKLGHKHEYDITTLELNFVKDTGGFFGYRIGPSDAIEDDQVDSGIVDDCPSTSTEAGKHLAWLLDFGLSVGYSLDYATVTQGIHSRTHADCELATPVADNFHNYEKHIAEDDIRTFETEGLSHIGMVKKLHEELAAVGLKEEYLDRLKNDGVEQFLAMWEASEEKRTNGQQIQRVIFDSAQLAVGASCERNRDCLSDKCQGNGNDRQCVCNGDQHCADGEFCNNRAGQNRCLADGSITVGETCDKNRECTTGKCQGSGNNRQCVCAENLDCDSGEYCNKRINRNQCLDLGTTPVGETCDNNDECQTRKCQGSGNDRQCVCAENLDCDSGEYCNKRINRNQCLDLGTTPVGETCDNNDECQTRKCQGSGNDRQCVCNVDSHCASGEFCNNRVNANRCLANRSLGLEETCDKNQECRSNKCQGSGSDRECVCASDSDCPGAQYCNKRAGQNRCLAERTLNIEDRCDKNKECRSNKCQGSGSDRECVCAEDSDCPGSQQCRKRVNKNQCR